MNLDKMATGMAKSSRLRVLFAARDLSGGGAERSLINTVRFLDRSRFEPAISVWRDVRDYPVPEDVPVFNLKAFGRGRTPLVIVRTAQLLRRWRPQVVFSFMGFPSLVTGLGVKLSQLKCAWFTSIQSVLSVEFGRLPGWFCRPILTWANGNIVISRGIQESLESVFGVPRDKIITIPNPISFADFPAGGGGGAPRTDGKYRLITMGRLVEEKDHATLIRAFAKVRQRAEAELVILGEGPLRGSLESLCSQLNVAADVRMPGFSKNPVEDLRRADLFVLSSVVEGLGMALIEAMGAGLPAVSTNCPFGPREIIQNKKTGLLVGVGDSDALADAILWMHENPQDARRFAQDGMVRVRETFSTERIVRQQEELFCEAAAETAPARLAGRGER